MKTVTRSLTHGFFAGLAGSLCCVTPLVLVLLGLSGVTGAAALAGSLQQNYRWTLFIPVALVLLLASIYFHVRRREGTCTIKNIKKQKWYVIGTVSFALIVWTLLLYAIVPAMFKLLG